MTQLQVQEGVRYLNLLETLSYIEDKPNITDMADHGNVHFKKVTLKGGTELKCHQNDCQVVVLWLRGKAQFSANGEEFTMQPGTLLDMPPNTPHAAVAESDCVFAVIKIQSA